MSNPETLAAKALAHFFLGLMKIDGTISIDEKNKVKLLVNKFRHGLPGDPDEVLAQLTALYDDAQWKGQMANDHMEAAFKDFDGFVESGKAVDGNLTTVIDLLEVLMEVDGVTPNEVMYLDRVRAGFIKRYHVKS